mmetsp:Transcript_151352/g.263837  ORF Transcript_151352/g.263837 Transcript_151352/m.263837 type:complete len:543 (+) Transcript_151352:46-1674(+)
MSLFEDPEFPPHVAMKDVPGNYEWVPASCLLNGKLSQKDRMPLFWRIEPSDMKQGSVGDCWLVAALACLANYPRDVESLFESATAAATPDGKYVVRLHDPAGRVCRITVDEFVPTIPTGPNRRVVGYEYMRHVPMFSRPNGEIWPLLLEKAMAKLLGSYAALHAGHTCAAFRALTGCAKQEMWVREPEGSHWTSNLLMEGSMRLFQRRYWKMLPYAHFGCQLLQFSNVHYMMSASITSSAEGEHVRQDGLIENHAYSIIEVRGFESLIMVRLRNPWGRGRWNGDWSDNSHLWDRFPSVAKALNFSPVGAVDSYIASGGFWMSFQDFARIFNNISVCHKSMDEGPGRTQIGIWHQQDMQAVAEAREKAQQKHFGKPSAHQQDAQAAEQEKVDFSRLMGKQKHSIVPNAHQQDSAQEKAHRQRSTTPSGKQTRRGRSPTPRRKEKVRGRSTTPSRQKLTSAMPQPASASCPRGHVLSPFQTPAAGFTCDGCHRLMPQGARLYGCRNCNYDLCEDCNHDLCVDSNYDLFVECLPNGETRIQARVH